MIIFKKHAKRIRDIIPMVIGTLLLFVLFHVSKIFTPALFNFLGTKKGEFPNVIGDFFVIIILLIFVVGGACLGGYITGKLLPKEEDDDLKFNDVASINTKPKKIYRYLKFISAFIKKIYKYIIVVIAIIIIILFVFPPFSINKDILPNSFIMEFHNDSSSSGAGRIHHGELTFVKNKLISGYQYYNLAVNPSVCPDQKSCGKDISCVIKENKWVSTIDGDKCEIDWFAVTSKKELEQKIGEIKQNSSLFKKTDNIYNCHYDTCYKITKL